jgi:hypothetical protein
VSGILERLERDDGFRDAHHRPVGARLVRAYCSALAVGREGMTQAELVALTEPGDPRGNVAALQRLLRPYLMRRGELLDFFHGQLRQAVEERYLAAPGERLAAHAAVADLFRGLADPRGERRWSGGSERGLAELPYHLAEAERLEEVYETLIDFGFLERKATDVGAVERPGADGPTTTYTGVYALQEDFELALAKLGGDAAGAGDARPLIVTGVDFGQGRVLVCPWCNTSSPFDDGMRGEDIPCPACAGPLRVNRFVVGEAR